MDEVFGNPNRLIIFVAVLYTLTISFYINIENSKNILNPGRVFVVALFISVIMAGFLCAWLAKRLALKNNPDSRLQLDILITCGLGPIFFGVLLLPVYVLFLVTEIYFLPKHHIRIDRPIVEKRYLSERRGAVNWDIKISWEDWHDKPSGLKQDYSRFYISQETFNQLQASDIVSLDMVEGAFGVLWINGIVKVS